jgi:hypothetical protein
MGSTSPSPTRNTLATSSLARTMLISVPTTARELEASRSPSVAHNGVLSAGLQLHCLFPEQAWTQVFFPTRSLTPLSLSGRIRLCSRPRRITSLELLDSESQPSRGQEVGAGPGASRLEGEGRHDFFDASLATPQSGEVSHRHGGLFARI